MQLNFIRIPRWFKLAHSSAAGALFFILSESWSSTWHGGEGHAHASALRYSSIWAMPLSLLLLAMSVALPVQYAIAMDAVTAQQLSAQAGYGNNRSLRELQQAALAGDANAQDWLGIYFTSVNDYVQAAQWFSMADQHQITTQPSPGFDAPLLPQNTAQCPKRPKC